MDPIIVLILISFIILLGAVGEFFFRKTGIPDVLWLLVFGFIIGQFTNLESSLAIMDLIPIFIALTLVIILFDGGLNLKLGSLVKNSALGSGIAILYFSLCTLFVFCITYLLHIINLFPEWNIWTGIVLGMILGGTSSIIVMPLVNLAKLEDKIKDVLSVESAFTDALCIVGVLTILDYLSNPGSDLLVIFKNIIGSISIGLIVGVLIGLIWIYFLKKLSSEESLVQYFYVFTLSLVIFLYVFVDFFGGASAIAVFAFGLVLGSGLLLNKIFKTNFYSLDKDIVTINKQIAFLIKSFFFVLIGMLFVFVFKSFLIAFILTIFLFFARALVMNLFPQTRTVDSNQKNLLYFFAPRGLAAGLLAISVAQLDIIPGASEFKNIVFSIIIITIVVSTIALLAYKFQSKSLIKTDKLSEKEKIIEPKKIKSKLKKK
jgi:cell volume regulation protein A